MSISSYMMIPILQIHQFLFLPPYVPARFCYLRLCFSYDETFNFNIPELKNMVLTVKVMDKDVGKDGKLGKCKIKLDKLGLDPTPHEYKGKVDNNLFSKDAFVYLNLSYHN